MHKGHIVGHHEARKRTKLSDSLLCEIKSSDKPLYQDGTSSLLPHHHKVKAEKPLQRFLRVQSSWLPLAVICVWKLHTLIKRAHLTGVTCSSPACFLSSCSLWRQTPSQTWESTLNPVPPGQPHEDLARLLWLSSRPWRTGWHVGTQEGERGRKSPPGSCQSSLYATGHLWTEIRNSSINLDLL